MAPVNQLSDTFFGAFSDHFDRAFAPVPDPSVNARCSACLRVLSRNHTPCTLPSMMSLTRMLSIGIPIVRPVTSGE